MSSHCTPYRCSVGCACIGRHLPGVGHQMFRPTALQQHQVYCIDIPGCSAGNGGDCLDSRSMVDGIRQTQLICWLVCCPVHNCASQPKKTSPKNRGGHEVG